MPPVANFPFSQRPCFRNHRITRSPTTRAREHDDGPPRTSRRARTRVVVRLLPTHRNRVPLTPFVPWTVSICSLENQINVPSRYTSPWGTSFSGESWATTAEDHAKQTRTVSVRQTHSFCGSANPRADSYIHFGKTCANRSPRTRMVFRLDCRRASQMDATSEFGQRTPTFKFLICS